MKSFIYVLLTSLFFGAMFFFGKITLLLSYVFALVLHEYFHMLAGEKYGIKISTMKFTPFGGMVSMPLKKVPRKGEAEILMSGPLVNLAVVLFLAALWWFFPKFHPLSVELAKANLSVAFANLIPCYPLDGGRLLSILLNGKKFKTATTLTLNISFATLFAAVFVISKLTNFTLLTMSVFFVLGIFTFLSDQSQRHFFALTPPLPIVEEKTLLVCETQEVFKVLRHLKPGYSYTIKIKSTTGTKTLTQDQFFQKIYSAKTAKQLKDIL